MTLTSIETRYATADVLAARTDVEARIGRMVLGVKSTDEASRTLSLLTNRIRESFDKMWSKTLAELDEKYDPDVIDDILGKHKLCRSK